MMSIQTLRTDERGMVLSTAMIFLAILGILGTTAIVVTTTDIKIGGNYKTNIQAFYIAEAGIQDGIGRLVNGTISDSGSESDTGWNSGNTYSTSGFSNSITVQHHVLSGSVVVDSHGNPLYKITSTGTSGNSEKTLEVVVRLTYPSPFDNALHGCDGVSFSSNGSTSSYSSSGQATDGQNGSIGTSNANADITLSSNADIQGNVSAPGSLTMEGNAQIRKDANANNGIALNGGNIIAGSANTNGNITMDQATISGNANASGNISLDHTRSKIEGAATAAGTITCRGGDCDSSNITSDDINAATTPSIGDPVVPTTECDPLDLDTLFDDADDIVTTNDNSELTAISENYPYNTTTDSFSMNSNETYTMGASGNSRSYYFSNFSMDSNAQVDVEGEVTLYVNGNFNLASNSLINFAGNATLTLYTTGNVVLGSNTSINNGGDPEDFKIYSNAESSDNSDYKFNLNSNSGFYGVVYAPKAAVQINSNSDAYGAVRGKYVEMASNAEFHYDEDLQEISGGGTPNGHEVVSWREVF